MCSCNASCFRRIDNNTCLPPFFCFLGIGCRCGYTFNRSSTTNIVLQILLLLLLLRLELQRLHMSRGVVTGHQRSSAVYRRRSPTPLMYLAIATSLYCILSSSVLEVAMPSAVALNSTSSGCEFCPAPTPPLFGHVTVGCVHNISNNSSKQCMGVSARWKIILIYVLQPVGTALEL